MIKTNNRVFITGGSGFIGANLIRKLLVHNYQVHVLVRSKKIPWRLHEIKTQISLYYGDITNSILLKKILYKIKPDYIIHLATFGSYPSQVDLNKIITTNVIGTKKLLEASKNIPYKRFINTGSSSEYGFKDKAMKETDFCDPISYYGLTKLATTHLCKVFAQIYNKPIITLRPFSVYGPFEEPSRFFPTIIKSLIKKQPINITPGYQRRDFIYVDDVVSAYVKSLKINLTKNGDVFNIGTGKEYSNDEVVKKLFDITKQSTNIKKGAYQKRSWDTNHWKANIKKTKKTLKWKPMYSLDKGLEKMYFWMKKNISFYN